MIKIVISWVYYTIPSGLNFFGTFWSFLFNFLIFIVWLRITEKAEVPEMRIWFISLIKSDLKWCIHLSRSLYLNFNYLVSVTACWPVSPRQKAHVAKFFGWHRLIRSVWRASKFSVFKNDWNCNFVRSLHHLFWLQLLSAPFGHYFSTFLNYIVWLRITDEG